MSVLDEILKLTPVIAVLLAYVLINRHQIKQDKIKIKEEIVDYFDDTADAIGDLMSEFGASETDEASKKFHDLSAKYNKARMRFLARITIYARTQTEINEAVSLMGRFDDILGKIDEKTYVEKNDNEHKFTPKEFNLLYGQFDELSSFYSTKLRDLKIEYNV